MRKTTITVAAALSMIAVAQVHAESGSVVPVATKTAEVTIAKGQKDGTVSIALEKGKYTFEAEQRKLTLADGETALTLSGNTLELTKATIVTATVTLDEEAEAETKVKVTVGVDGDALAAVKEVYTKKLTIAANQASDEAYAADFWLEEIAVNISEVGAKINAIGIEEYGMYQKDGEIKDLEEAITGISNEVVNANKNYLAHKAADGAYPDIQKEVEDLQSVYNNANDEIKTAFADQLAAVKANAEQFKAGADEAYKNKTCATAYSEENLKLKKDALISHDLDDKGIAKGSVIALKNAISSGNTGLLNYLEIQKYIGEANSRYGEISQALYDELLGNNSRPKKEVEDQVYKDTYANALTQLNDALKAIADAKKIGKNATAEDVTTAKNSLSAAIESMETVANNTLADVTKLRGYYDTAMGQLTTPNDNIKKISDSYATFKDTKEVYESQVNDLIAQSKAIEDKLNAANKDHSINAAGYPKLDDDLKKLAADTKALQDKVNHSIAEETDYNATKTELAALKAAYNKAVEATNKLKSKAKVYKTAVNEDNTVNVHILAEVDGEKTEDVAYDIFAKYPGLDTRVKADVESVEQDVEKNYVKGGYNADGTENYDASEYYGKGFNTAKGNIGLATKALNEQPANLKDKVAKLFSANNQYNVAIAALETVVGEDGDVTIDGKVGSKSYADSIAGLKEQLKKWKDGIDTAMALTDESEPTAHYDAVMGLGTNSKIYSDARRLARNFADNKTIWEQANLNSTCEKLVKEAQHQINVHGKDIPEEYKAEDYGKRATTGWTEGEGEAAKEYKSLNVQRESVEGLLKKAQDKVNDLLPSTEEGGKHSGNYSVEDLAILQTVLKTINEDVAESASQLKTVAEKVKAEYTIEKNIKAELVAKVKVLNINIEGGKIDNQEIKKIEDLCSDESKKAELTEAAAKLSDSIKKLYNAEPESGEIKKSFEDETLYKDAPDQGEGEKLVKGYRTLLSEIETEIKALRDKATGYDANYKAYQEVVKSLTEKVHSEKTYDEHISAATDDVKSVTEDDDARKYYDGLIKAESDKKTTIETGNKKAYDEQKSVEQKQSFLDQIKASIETLDGLKAKAKANDEAYKGEKKDYKTGQKSIYDKALADLNDLSVIIAGKATVNPEHYAEWSKDLADFREGLTNYKNKIEGDWKTGKAADNNDASVAAGQKIANEIASYKSSFDEKYNAAVVADNQGRLKAFNAAYDELTKSYKDCVDKIAELSHLDIAKGHETTLYIETATGKVNIYQFAEQIRALLGKVNETYTEKEIWDENEENKKEAEKYKKDVEDCAEVYISEVNEAAKKAYDTAYGDAADNYYSELENVKDFDCPELFDTVEGEKIPAYGKFKKAFDLKAKYAEAYDKFESGVAYKTFAAKWEKEIKDALAGMSDLLKGAADEYAAVQWPWELQDRKDLAELEKAAIETFTYDKAYTDWYNYDKNANAIFKAIEESEADGSTLAGYQTLHSLLNTVAPGLQLGTLETRDVEEDVTETHTSCYWSCYEKQKTSEMQSEWLVEKMKNVDDLKERIDALKAYAGALLVRNAYGVQYVYYGMNNPEDVEKGGVFSSGTSCGVVGNYWWLKKYSVSYSTLDDPTTKDEELKSGYDTFVSRVDVDGYKTVLVTENLGITDAVKDLKLDYDKASAELITSERPDIDETLKSWSQAIDAIVAKNDRILKDYTTGKVDKEGLPLLDDDKNPIKSTKEEAHAAYLALEKELGALKETLKSNITAEKDLAATTGAALQSRIDNLLEEFSGMDFDFEDYTALKAKYADQVAELRAQGAAIQENVAAVIADKTVLLEEKNITSDIDKLEAKFVDLDNKIATDRAKWNTHYQYYRLFKNELETYKANLQAIFDASDYEHKETRDFGTTPEKPNIQLVRDFYYDRYLKSLNNKLDGLERYKDGNSGKPYFDESRRKSSVGQTWEEDLTEYARDLAYYDLDQTGIEVADIADAIEIDGNLLTEDDFYAFLGDLQRIKDANHNAYVFYKQGADANVYNVWAEVDGREIVDEEGEPTTKEVIFRDILSEIDGSFDGYTTSMARLEQIKGMIEKLLNDYDAAKFLVGDVNGDLKVTILDYAQLADDLLNAREAEYTEQQNKIADANKDKAVNVADLQAIVNIINEVYVSPAKGQYLSAVNDAISVEVENDVLTLAMHNQRAYVGMQMDITLPDGASIGEQILASRASGHEMMVNNISGNTYRVIVMNSENNTFSGNNGDIFGLSLVNLHGTVAVDNIIFTDAKAKAYSFSAEGSTTAIKGIEAQQSMTEKIFSIGGQMMNGMKKGVNIVKTAAGNAKKVMSK